MEKEFVTYEQALALKELGFDEPCLGGYIRFRGSGSFELAFYKYRNVDFNTTSNIYVSAPLYQQTFRWFRDKCDLQHTITWNKHYPKTPYEWEVRKTWRDELLRPYGIGGMSATYEEAESECLNKLIQLVKTNEQ